jgi:hypothetical protein
VNGAYGNDGPFKLLMQQNTNLVIYDKNKKAEWGTGTYGKGKNPFLLRMRDDTNLVLREGKALWSSCRTAPGRFLHPSRPNPSRLERPRCHSCYL